MTAEEPADSPILPTLTAWLQGSPAGNIWRETLAGEHSGNDIPALVALVVTAAVVATAEHRVMRIRSADPTPAARPALGLVSSWAATMLVVVLRNPAIPVAAASVGIRLVAGKEEPKRVVDGLG